jgi:Na+/melibiose symporter-like transporter
MMQPGMVYEYPLWGVGVLLAGAAALGAILLGLAVRPLLSLELRRRHNDVAAAIFSVIGVTFAVLLAFVAMVVWQHYNSAKATSYAEAGSVRDVYVVSLGFSDWRSRCCATAFSGMSRPWSESNGRRKPEG